MTKTSPLSIETLREVRRLQIRTKHLVDTLLAGAYRSAFRGQGMEFTEVRAYEPGDDVRYIDWNVTARMDMPFVKCFEEERQLTVMLMIDVSASSFFGSQKKDKQALMAEIGALLTFSAIRNNDRIGLILFSSEVELYLPPKRGVRHAMRVVRELMAYQPRKKGTDLRAALTFLGSVQRRSCICFLLSDFLTTGFQHALRVASKRYDLIAVRVRDPHEVALPALRLLKFRDLESDLDLLVNTSDSRVQSYFQKQVEDRASRQTKMMQSLGVGFIDICSDQPYAKAIEKYFKSRRRLR